MNAPLGLRAPLRALVASLALAACGATTHAPAAPARPLTSAEIARQHNGRVLTRGAWREYRPGDPEADGMFRSGPHTLVQSYEPPGPGLEVIESADHFVVLVPVDQCHRGYPPNFSGAIELWLPLPRRRVEYIVREATCSGYDSNAPIP